MTGEHLLILIALIAATSLTTAVRRKSVSWSIVNGLFLAAAVAGYLLAPERAGWWLIGPFALFVVMPIVCIIQVNRLLVQRRYRVARLFARLAYVLHPSRGVRRFVQMNEAFQQAADGNVEQAAAILRATGHEQEMQLELLRLQNRWDEIVAHIEAAGGDPLEHGVGVMYLRALGETGRLDKLVDVYRVARARWAKQAETTDELANARLFVAAFLGQPALVEQICAGPVRHYGDAVKRYWLAMAHAAGGDREHAAALWRDLMRDPEYRTRTAAEFRASHPPVRVDEPSPQARDALAQLGADLQDVALYAGPTTTPILSYGLAVVLVAVHVFVWLRTQTDPMAVYDLGLFWSPAVLAGEWWRVLTAVFLHAGWLHLGMNVLGTVWFGPFVERFLGKVRFVIIYIVGGAGGFALLAGLAALGVREPTAALGASGGVMALIGASMAIYLRGASRSAIAASRLRDMVGFVGIQVVFDLVAPRVSMTGHLAGLAIGFLIGLSARRRAA